MAKEISLNQLRMLIDDTSNELHKKKNILSRNSLKTIHKDASGHEEVMSLAFDFEKGLEEVKTLNSDLIRYKTTLQKANLETKINEEDTIATALVKLDLNRKLISTLDTLVSKEETKHRRTDSSYSNSYYIEHIQLNFDKEALIEYREQLKCEINQLESQVDYANTNTTVII